MRFFPLPSLRKAVRGRIRKKEAVTRERLLDQRKEAREAEETAQYFLELGHPDIALKHTSRIVVAETKAKAIKRELLSGPKRLKYLTASGKARKRLKRQRLGM